MSSAEQTAGSTVRSSVMKASGVHWHLQQLLRPSEAKGIGVRGGAGDRELWARCRELVSVASAFLLVSSCLETARLCQSLGGMKPKAVLLQGPGRLGSWLLFLFSFSW